MKKYIILLAFLLPLSILAQSAVVKADTIKVKKKGIFKKKAKKVKPIVVQEPQSVVPKLAVTKIAKDENDELALAFMLDSSRLRKKIFRQDSIVRVFTILPRGIQSQEFNDADTLAKKSRYWVFQVEEREYADSVYMKTIKTSN
jgi:hypothetical protein